MSLKGAARFVCPALLVFALGCEAEKAGGPDLDTSFEVSPLFVGEDEGIPVQFSATLDGAPVAVTWESSDPTIATISPTGLASTSRGGRVAITATLASDPTRKRSATLTSRTLLGLGLSSGVAVTGLAAETGETLLYRIYVPEGSTNLTVTSSGGPGDADIYVRPLVPPTYSTYTCVSYNAGNTENCEVANPQRGTWYIMVDAWETFSGLTLTATVTP